MKDKSNTFTWEWEDGETGLIRTIKIPMPNLEITKPLVAGKSKVSRTKRAAST